MRTRVASQVGYPLLGVLLILVTWLLICWIGNLPTVVLPTPDKVLRAFIDRFDLLVSEGWFTRTRFSVPSSTALICLSARAGSP